MIVVDASLALGWLFHDEQDAYAKKALRQFERGVAPAIWPLEVMNGLLVAERRGRITRKDVRSSFADLQQFPIALEGAPPPATQEAILALATKHKLSAYDAAYLELALRNELPLGTLDAKLRKACKAERVPLAFSP